MNISGSQLADRLSTIHHDDPAAIRTELAETLLEYFDTNLALHLQCAKDSEGKYHFTAPVAVGDKLVDGVLPFCEGPALDCPWLPHRIDSEVIDNFICVHRYYPDGYLQNLEVIQKMMNPLDITGELRCVFYDGPTLLGYLCMMRQGDDAKFRDGERKIARAATAEIKSLLSMANSLESARLDSELFAMLTPAGGIEYASDAFGEWADKTRSSYLRRRARDADQGIDRLGIEIHGGAEVRMTRLDGDDGVRYLVAIDELERAKIRPVHRLTDRQYEIAKYAAAGATSREIGKTLDISHHTVKVHLRNIYERLGIGSRTELVTALEGV